ncbi:Dynein regulatory complex subunit 6 [Coemansia furcata]|uniref:Dynein regulatory complex subunit 6 n=1 Tax=Coemansia furcata TaxID=417177 RepID=A0ACC1LKV6_9FUNG|nr:Dynein regulatory complex subunit 6 [Coemansia furcata]
MPELIQPAIVLRQWGIVNCNASSITSRSAEGDVIDVTRSLHDQNISTLARRAGPALRRLSLSISPHITDAGIYSLMHYGCVNIRHLELSANGHISSDMLVALIGHVGRALEHLILSTAKTDDAVVKKALSSAPNLVHLDLSCCRLITDDAFPRPEHMLVKYRQSLPRLRALVLNGCTRVGDVAVGRIGRAFGASLQTLDISHTIVTTRCLCFLAVAASMNQAGPQATKGVLTLHTLYMNNIAFEPGPRYTRSEVDAGIHFNVTTWNIEQIHLYVPHLTSLTIAGTNYMVTDALIIQIARNCHQLTSIDVRDSFRVDHDSMFALSEHCAGLEYASFGGCIGCLDTGVLALVRGCPRLKGLNLLGLGITDTSLAAIGNSLHYLEVLVLDMCRLISTEGIRAVVEGSNGMGCLFTLTELSFMRCRRINNDVVEWCKVRLKPNAIVRSGLF